jgi:predicted enzyme related to lactoylglutathione lyase
LEAKSAKIPCIFPVIRELPLETRSLMTASTASESAVSPEKSRSPKLSPNIRGLAHPRSQPGDHLRKQEKPVNDRRDRFVWYELATTDRDAARAFYGEVMDWRSREMSVPISYTLFTVEGMPVCGLMDLSMSAREKGAKPRWLGYVGVEDVDVSVDRIRRLGGSVLVPPTEVASLSRFAVVADPQMASFALVSWPKRQQLDARAGTQGRVAWHELLASDSEKALDFYRELFGWQRAEAAVGPRSTYQRFSIEGETIGGIVTKPRTVAIPSWIYYFNVENIDSAAKRVKQHGGEILEGPVEALDGRWVLKCADPQAALFALSGKRSYRAIVRLKPIPSRDRPQTQGKRRKKIL